MEARRRRWSSTVVAACATSSGTSVTVWVACSIALAATFLFRLVDFGKFVGAHDRLESSGVAVNRALELLFESCQLASALLELIGVFRAGLLASRKPGHHLSQPGGQRARQRGAGTSGRCRRRCRHRFHKSFRLRRQAGLLFFSQHSRPDGFPESVCCGSKLSKLQEEVAGGFQRALGD